MIHQLGFKVTVSGSSQEALLRLERMLSIPAVGSLTIGHPLFKLVDDLARDGNLDGFVVEVHSIDINWDDVDEPLWICMGCAAKMGLDVEGESEINATCAICNLYTKVYEEYVDQAT